MSRPIVIVGAGLAGLVCGRRLNRAGRPVLVLDQDDRPGGKIKTDIIDGFRIDRGFQVFFSAYPHAGLDLDLDRLNFKTFVPGGLFWDGRKLKEVREDDPIVSLLSGYLKLQDLVRVQAWNSDVKRMSFTDIWSSEDMSAELLLRQKGFSDHFLDRFARPFFGGIFLDRSLQVSSRMFTYVWKMLQEGKTGVPALGMEEIPRQIAADIPESCFRFGVTVDQVVRDNGAACGVKLSTGEVIEAESVVLASGAAEASRLSGLPTPKGALNSSLVAFDAPEPYFDEPILLLNAPGYGQVSHVICASQAAPELAPKGRHLMLATVLGEPGDSDDLHFAKAVQYDIRTMLPKVNVDSWRPLAVRRVRAAQMAQPSGFREALPKNRTSIPGLFFAGEFTEYSSTDGACLSGQRCAAAILRGAE